MEHTIDHGTLAQLAHEGTINTTQIFGVEGGWSVRVSSGKGRAAQQRVLTAQRSREVRTFRKLETLVSYLKGLGILQFLVDAHDFEPTGAARTRPDRSAAMKETHQAAAYDKWFRGAVQASLDDPRASVSDTTARERLAAKKAELRKRAG